MPCLAMRVAGLMLPQLHTGNDSLAVIRGVWHDWSCSTTEDVEDPHWLCLGLEYPPACGMYTVSAICWRT
eukprot:756078-Pelagomonas_calceolata.AAC.5